MSGNPTRRMFFVGAGATLAAPLAAATGVASNRSRDELAALLAALEDQAAVRAVQQQFVRLVNAGARAELAALCTDAGAVDATIRSLALDADAWVALADDGTATARVPCIVETARPIEPCGTLVEMARLQGDGFVAHTERRVLATSFVKIGGTWKIRRVELVA